MRAFVLLTALCAFHAAASERWLLAVGENRGLAGEEPLRFAEDDARRVAQTFEELASVPRANAVIVSGGDAKTVRDALSELEARMKSKGGTQERLVIYVSSHAGDGELHLRNTTLPLSEVVDFLKRAPAAVGLLVVDACRSGVMTGTKGLKPTQERVWTADVAPLEGRILISASGADEFAQESDVLGGSYFTHHLLTGLRGAADASGDRRVTLDEAYRWAWTRTVEATFSTKGGVQTPRFKVDLRGQGELVLTDLNAADSQLVLDVEAPGRWLVVDVPSGAVVADVEKPKGPLALALPPSEYRLRLRFGNGYVEKNVALARGSTQVLREGDFESAPFTRVALKGRDESLYVLSAAASFSSPVVGGLSGSPGLEARLRLEREWAGPLNYLSFAVAARDATSATFGFRHSEVEARAGTGHRWDWARVTVAVGVETGALMVLQGALPDGGSRTSVGPLITALSEVRFHLLGPVDVFAGGNAGAVLLKKSAGISPVLRASGAAGVAIQF